MPMRILQIIEKMGNVWFLEENNRDTERITEKQIRVLYQITILSVGWVGEWWGVALVWFWRDSRWAMKEII